MKMKTEIVILITAILGTVALFWYEYTHDLPHNQDSLETILVMGTIATALFYFAVSGLYFASKMARGLFRRITR
jgi:hypothetical protein